MMEENPVRHGRHAALLAVAEKHRQRWKSSIGAPLFSSNRIQRCAVHSIDNRLVRRVCGRNCRLAGPVHLIETMA
jgi:hypothetical protein